MSGWRFGLRFLAVLLALDGALCAQGAAEDSDRRYAEAAALIQSGETRAAVALLEDLARDRPGDADVQLLLGTAFALLPRRERAVAALLRALELRPTDGRTHAAVGSALARLGESGAALQVFERAVALDPRSRGRPSESRSDSGWTRAAGPCGPAHAEGPGARIGRG